VALISYHPAMTTMTCSSLSHLQHPPDISGTYKGDKPHMLLSSRKYFVFNVCM